MLNMHPRWICVTGNGSSSLRAWKYWALQPNASWGSESWTRGQGPGLGSIFGCCGHIISGVSSALTGWGSPGEGTCVSGSVLSLLKLLGFS